MNAQQKSELRIPQWTFGDRVRKARHESGMDQKEFAAAIGIKSSTLAAYETGRANPRFKDVPVLSKRLELLTRIPRSWFMGFDDQTMD
ncbi:helix-turn-helix domain-containing protein [Paramicrobacterium agarici]|uniref:helix-turn-helix domain-containing protein n=1 Tax=Paramicrobacterium agarici TaxID=630514 RepID=UPI00114F33E3|nr:helix-turn-helix transcriptional regulator [Microbacterium agarici]